VDGFGRGTWSQSKKPTMTPIHDPERRRFGSDVHRRYDRSAESANPQLFGYEGLLRATEEVAHTEALASLNDVAHRVVERAKGVARGRLSDDTCVVVGRFIGSRNESG
jgi:hypothetical protein